MQGLLNGEGHQDAVFLEDIRPSTTRSTPSVEGEGCDRGRNQKASSFGGDTESGDDEFESNGEGVEMVTSEADYTEREITPLVSGRAVSTRTRTVEGRTTRVSLMLRLLGQLLAWSR